MSPLLFFTLILYFVCARMKIIYEHAQKSHTEVEGRDGGRGVLTKLIRFCEQYNGLPLYFITDSNLLLSCFSVVFLYIIVQKTGIFYIDP